MNKDGKISQAEFMAFWKAVKTVGHSEEEILEELQSIKSGESWVGFNGINKNPSMPVK